MENLKKLMMLLACMGIVATFTSCLSDDDDDKDANILTPAQKSAQIFEMAGTYNGFVYTTSDKTMKPDSIACTWHVSATDSVLTIPNFPVAMLANGINDSIARKNLLKAVGVTFKGSLHPYYNNNHTKGYYTFWLLANDDKMEFTIEDEGESHNVKVGLAYQMYVNASLGNAVVYSVGEYMSDQMLSYILVKDVAIDNKTFTTYWPLYIYGKK